MAIVVPPVERNCFGRPDVEASEGGSVVIDEM